VATRTMILFFKRRLAELAALQIKAKRARKRLPEAELAALRLELGGSGDPAWNAQRDVVMRRIALTACLNLYHEVRGSGYRHGIRKGLGWMHDSRLALLRKEVAELQ
jgi:hypothetical protein